MSPKKLFVITTYTSIALIFAVIIPYVLKFSKLSLSDNSQTWGAFGDYFGGVLSPLFGMLNLMVLIFITFQIANGDDERNKNELENQKEFALYSLKHDSLKELNKILELIQPEVMKSDSESCVKIFLIRNDLNAYVTTHSYLFPSFSNKTWEPLIKSLKILAETSEEYFQSEYDNLVQAKVIAELENFIDLKIEFIIEVQNQIIA